MAAAADGARLDEGFEATLAAAEAYEAQRAALHAALREAHVAGAAAEWALSSSYATFHVSCVPQGEDAAYSAHVGVTVADDEGGRLEYAPDRLDADRRTDGDAVDASDAKRAEAADADPSKALANAAAETAAARKDPAKWFSSMPPPELCAAQAAYRRVLDLAVAAANAQADARRVADAQLAAVGRLPDGAAAE